MGVDLVTCVDLVIIEDLVRCEDGTGQQRLYT